MIRGAALLTLLAVAACGSLPDAGDGVVALELFPPDTLSVTIGHPITLRARALNISGDSVAIAIYWRTPDTAFVTLDSVSGLLTGTSAGQARIQARAGSLLSDILTFSVRAADTTGSGGIRQP